MSRLLTTAKAPGALSDRTLNRMLVGAALIILVGVPLIAVIYAVDRYVAAPPPIVDQKATELEDAVRAKPNDLTLRLRLAGAYTAGGRYAEGISQFDQVLEAAAVLKADESLGIRKTANLGRGDALRLSGQLDAAVTAYQAVVDLAEGGEFAAVDLELETAYFDLGGIALEQGRPADAVTALQRALAINHTDADTLHLLGRALLASGSTEAAIEPLRDAVLYVPIGWCDPYATLGQAYGALGRSEQAAWAGAMATFCLDSTQDVRGQLEGLVGGSAGQDALVGLGLVSEVLGENGVAADWYRQALAADPDDFTAASGLTRVARGSAAPSLTPADPASPVPAGGTS